MLGCDSIRFGSQTIPIIFISFFGIAGIETIQKKFFQFFVGSIETGRGGDLNGGDGGLDRLFAGSVHPGADNRSNPRFLFGRELKKTWPVPLCFSSHNNRIGVFWQELGCWNRISKLPVCGTWQLAAASFHARGNYDFTTAADLEKTSRHHDDRLHLGDPIGCCGSTAVLCHKPLAL